MFFRRGSRFRGKRAANRKKNGQKRPFSAAGRQKFNAPSKILRGKKAPSPPQGGKRFMRAERYCAAKTPLLRRGAAKDRAMRPAFF